MTHQQPTPKGMSKEEAQQMFDTLMDFGMAHPELPQDVLEALDTVANYCGDIAKGRKVQ